MILPISLIFSVSAFVACGATNSDELKSKVVAKISSIPVADHYIVVMKQKKGSKLTSLDDDFEKHSIWLQQEIEAFHPESQIHGVFQGDSSSISSGGSGSEAVNEAGKSKVLKEFKIAAKLLSGYHGKFDQKLIQKLQLHKDVAYIAPNQKYHLHYVVSPVETVAIGQENAPWGLSRISTRNIPKKYGHYEYPKDAGKNARVYVIDTGIRVDHEEFEGKRAIWGKTFVDGEGDFDEHGHGTHCAGTIAGKTFGVAKEATVVALKVFSSDGYASTVDILKALEYVAGEHHNRNASLASVVSMSLGGSRDRPLDDAVNAITKFGVHVSVAAGNEDEDACYSSPSAAELCVTVAAMDKNDARAWFSNHGKCVDIFAPGVDVLSCGIESTSSKAIMSGTSMAAPHVAGVLALYASGSPSLSPAQVKDQLVLDSTKNVLFDVDDNTPNNLVSTVTLLKHEKNSENTESLIFF